MQSIKKYLTPNIFILGLFLFISIQANAQHGLENIIVEKYYISTAKDTINSAIGGKLPIGSVTYRIYVDMLPGYKFQAAFGIPGHELRLATTTTFFNNEDKGGLIPNVIPDRNLMNNTVMLDSWISTGAASESNLGILKSEDNGLETIVNANGILQNDNPAEGIALKYQDGFIAGDVPKVTAFAIDTASKIFGNTNQTKGPVIFSTSNGSWACMNGSSGITPDNKVLIAQMTTDGIFTFDLNIQIGKPGGVVEQYVAKNPKGKEIQLATLSYPVTDLSPEVKLITPKNKTVISGSVVPIKVNANDKDGTISLIEYFIDNKKVGESISEPYLYNWTATGKEAELKIVATDNLGLKTTTSPIKIIIK